MLNHRLKIIKARQRRLIDRAGGSTYLAEASVTRVGRAALDHYGNINMADNHMPVDVVADLEMEVGQPVVTEILADLLGFKLVPIQAAHAHTVATLSTAIATANKEMADVISVAIGRCSDAPSADLQKIVRELDEAIDAAQSARRVALAEINRRTGGKPREVA